MAGHSGAGSRPAFWNQLGFGEFPVLLAPLAGVSDHPFRRVCARAGATLTYVEMLSATAIVFRSKRTFEMMRRHETETRLGVQLTGKSAAEVGEAVALIDDQPFDTVDLNMGCPVNKVTRAGCGSAILRDPERVYQTVKAARAATAKPLSAKIRLGWDKGSRNFLETAAAVESGGADFMTVHGRLRSDDYSAPVDLEAIATVCKAVRIPVFANGNIFSLEDGAHVRRVTGCAGIMVSRGALGNPWLFRDLSLGREVPVTLGEWRETVRDHLEWQQDEYGGHGNGAVCMRKHLLWYAKGWPGVKPLREKINTAESMSGMLALIDEFAGSLAALGCVERQSLVSGFAGDSSRFTWDPKYEMDRGLDRGVGDDGLVDLGSSPSAPQTTGFPRPAIPGSDAVSIL